MARDKVKRTRSTHLPARAQDQSPLERTLTIGVSDDLAALAAIVPQVVGTVDLVGQAANVAPTAIPGTTPAGWYRPTYTVRKTQVAPSTSTLQVRYAWTDAGVACTHTFPAFTTNVTNDTDSAPWLLHKDGGAPITYAIVNYGST